MATFAKLTSSTSQTEKHLSIHIFADTDTKINGYALLAPDYAKENDRAEWKENNITEISNLS